jgi:hypothetical protein
MNHKILTNQIMLNLTEGYLSPYPSLPLSLGSLGSLSLSLSLSYPAIKNLLARSLLSTWSLLGPTFPTWGMVRIFVCVWCWGSNPGPCMCKANILLLRFIFRTLRLLSPAGKVLEELRQAST